MQMQQQKATLTHAFELPAVSAQKRTMVMMVRIKATRSEPRAIEPSEVVLARMSGLHTAGRQPKQPSSV